MILRRRLSIATLLSLAALSHSANAQPSTAGLRGELPPWRFEVAAGGDPHPLSLFTGAPATPGDRARGATVSARWNSGGRVGARVAGWWVERDKLSAYPVEPSLRGQYRESSRVFAIAVSGDYEFRIGHLVALTPSVGLGYAPYGRGSFPGFVNDGNSGSAFVVRPVQVSGHGMLLTGSFAISVGHLVLEPHFLLINSSNLPLDDFQPIVIGWRF